MRKRAMMMMMMTCEQNRSDTDSSILQQTFSGNRDLCTALAWTGLQWSKHNTILGSNILARKLQKKPAGGDCLGKCFAFSNSYVCILICDDEKERSIDKANYEEEEEKLDGSF